MRGLSRATRKDADLPAALRLEVHRGGRFECTPFAREVGVIIGEDEILAAYATALVGENTFALYRGGDEGSLGDASMFVTGQHESRESRFQWQGRHFFSFVGERACFIECTQVVKQVFRANECLFGGRVEPTEITNLMHARGFEHEHRFGEIDSANFGRFEFRAARVIGLAPQAECATRSGASGATRALLGGGA